MGIIRGRLSRNYCINGEQMCMFWWRKKFEGSLDNMLPSIWSNRWAGEIHKEAQGSSGGILILQDKRLWKGELMRLERWSITGKLVE